MTAAEPQASWRPAGLVDKVGRRGFLLGVLALASIARGFTVLSGERWDEDAGVYFSLWPAAARVGIWVTAGLIALVAAARPGWRDVGFMAIGFAFGQRLSGHLWSWLMWIIPGAPGGDVYAIAWAAWWACLLWVLWLVARWVEDRRPE